MVVHGRALGPTPRSTTANGSMQSLFFSRNEYFSILGLTKTRQYCSKPVKDVSHTYDGKVTRHLASALLAHGGCAPNCSKAG